eukprot:TRINITY_DN5114_c0_g1_i4.p1 TRINITY_DN5114_c0_g1~~TRINITY_DN5114_c0_g1_i4.p1  ORF type:complete len:2006 (-),score=388.98 TRINITY_DN5114_c0_g1_i4:487-6504(-)
MDQESKLEPSLRPKYRLYKDEIIRVLQSFDDVGEWADLIKSIQKLFKVIHRSTEFQFIPESLTVAKRLAQCLNPNLPSGVHIKALETYELIFGKNKDHLSQDLILFSSGLFPFFQYASTQVKPKVLHLVLTYYVPLGTNIGLALPGLVQCLLPGLEEENTQPYESTLEIFNQLSEGPTREMFFKAMWRCLLFSSSTSRLCALNFFLQKFSKATSIASLDEMRPEKGDLVVPAMIHVLQDQNVLVLRTALELLALHFQIHHSNFTEEEYVSLLRAASRTLLRREMAISRRFYCWILGITNINSGQVTDSSYYTNHVHRLLARAVQDLFASRPQKKADVIKPFRILSCLLERSEVGSEVMKDIILDMLNYMAMCMDDEQTKTETSKTFPKLLDLVKSDVIWSKLTQSLEDELNTSLAVEVPVLRVVGLVHLMLEVSRFFENEVKSTHLPGMFINGALKIRPFVEKSRIYHILQIIDLLKLILQKLTPPTLADLKVDLEDHAVTSRREMIESLVQAYYDGFCEICRFTTHYIVQNESEMFAKVLPIIEMPSAPSQKLLLDHICLLKSSMELLLLLSCKKYRSLHIASQKNEGDDIGKVMKSIRNRVAFISSNQGEGSSDIPAWVHSVINVALSSPVVTALLGIGAFIKLVFSDHLTPSTLASIFMTSFHSVKITRRLWDLLGDAYNSCCFDVVSMFLCMNELNPAAARSVIAEGISQQDPHSRLQGYKRLAKLWNISCSFGLSGIFQNGIWLLLDGLKDQSPSIQQFCSTWLIDSLDNSERLLHPILTILMDPSTRRSGALVYHIEYDTRRTRYAFQTLQNMLQIAGKRFFNSLADQFVSQDLVDAHKQHISYDSEPYLMRLFHPSNDESTYLNLVLEITLRFMRGKVSDNGSSFDISNSLVRVHSIHLLRSIITDTDASDYATLDTKEKVKKITLMTLVDVSHSPQSALQVELLRLLEVLLPWTKKSDQSTVKNSLKLTLSNSSYAPNAEFLSTEVDSETVIDVLKNAFSSPEKGISIRPWIEFLGSVLPSLGKSLPHFVKHIIPRICQSVDELLDKPDIRGQGQIVYSSDLILYLHGLIIIMNYCYGRNLVDTEIHGDEPIAQYGIGSSLIPERARSLVETLRNLIPGDDVFGIQINTEEPKGMFLFSLPKIIGTIIRLWSVFWTPDTKDGEQLERSQQVVVVYLRKFMQAIVINQSKMFFNSLPGAINLITHKVQRPLQASQSASSDHVTSLTRQQCIVIVCTILNERMIPREKVIGPLSESIKFLLSSNQGSKDRQKIEDQDLYLRILITYLGEASSADLIPLWSYFSSVFKEAINHSTNPGTLLLLFRSICSFNRSTTREKKHVRKELQDITQRMIDICAQYASGSFDINPSVYIHGTEEEPKSEANPVIVTSKSRKASTDGRDLSDKKLLVAKEALQTLSMYLAKVLEDVYDDEEKKESIISAAFSKISVHLRQPTKESAECTSAVLGFLGPFCTYSNVEKAVWKREVWDIFTKTDIFRSPLEVLKKWKPIIHDIVLKDPNLFPELLAKPSASIQAPVMLFANRENEVSNKGRLLKRLAFVLLCGDVDQHHSAFGEIQEKIAECIKASYSGAPLIPAVLLCARVLLVRMSKENLTSLWPTIINEVIRIFIEKKDKELQLAACKFIDFAIAVVPEEFHFFEWMFTLNPGDLALIKASLANIQAQSDLASPLRPLMFPAAQEKVVASILSTMDTDISYYGPNGLRRPLILSKIATDQSVAQGVLEISLSCLRPSPLSVATLEHDQDMIEAYFMQEFCEQDITDETDPATLAPESTNTDEGAHPNPNTNPSTNPNPDITQQNSNAVILVDESGESELMYLDAPISVAISDYALGVGLGSGNETQQNGVESSNSSMDEQRSHSDADGGSEVNDGEAVDQIQEMEHHHQNLLQQPSTTQPEVESLDNTDLGVDFAVDTHVVEDTHIDANTDAGDGGIESGNNFHAETHDDHVQEPVWTKDKIDEQDRIDRELKGDEASNHESIESDE